LPRSIPLNAAFNTIKYRFNTAYSSVDQAVFSFAASGNSLNGEIRWAGRALPLVADATSPLPQAGEGKDDPKRVLGVGRMGKMWRRGRMGIWGGLGCRSVPGRASPRRLRRHPSPTARRGDTRSLDEAKGIGRVGAGKRARDADPWGSR